MTGGRHCDPLLIAIAPFLLSLRAEGMAISGKQNSKIKRQNDRAKFKNVVRGFSLVRTTLKGRTTKGGPHNDRRSLPAFFYCHCERSVAIPVGHEIAELVPSETRNLALPPDFVVA